MPEYTYITRTSQGRPAKGRIQGDSRAAVVNELRTQGHRVLNVSAMPARWGAELLWLANPSNWLPVRSKEVETCFAQLETLMRNGVALLESIRIVEEQARNPRLRNIWRQVATDIQKGMELSACLDKHDCFPALVVQMTMVGEQNGSLETSFGRIAKMIRAKRKLTNSLLTPLFYPAVVLAAAFFTTIFMAIHVFPELEKFLSVIGRTPPAMTQILLNSTRFLVNNTTLIFGVLVGVPTLFLVLFSQKEPRRWMERIIFRIPFIGQLIRLSATASFSRTCGTLLKSGITVLQALKTCELVSKNSYVADKVAQIRKSIMAGSTLSEPIRDANVFTHMLSRMVSIGEASGALDDVLCDLASYHEKQLREASKRVAMFIEPAVILLVGFIVGFIYLSFFTALYSIKT